MDTTDTTIAMTNCSLKDQLYLHYGKSPSGKRVDPSKIQRFVADDRAEKDRDSRNRLYSYFCEVIVEATSETGWKVTLRGNVPMSEAVTSWEESLKIKRTAEGVADVLEIHGSQGDEAKLRSLASLFEAMVAPGTRYEVSNYKYVCPRTAGSLRKLADVLASYPSGQSSNDQSR